MFEEGQTAAKGILSPTINQGRQSLEDLAIFKFLGKTVSCHTNYQYLLPLALVQ